MAFTYTGDLNNALDYVRFKIDDKEEEYAIFQDGEINYFIDQLEEPLTEQKLNKVSLNLLKQILQTLLRSPSRERSGQYEVYRSDSQALRIAISELEDEIKKNAGFAKPSFGGVYKSEVQNNRHNDSFTETVFYRDRVYRDVARADDFFEHQV